MPENLDLLNSDKGIGKVGIRERLRFLLSSLMVLIGLALPAHSASMTLLDRNPVLSQDYLAAWPWDKGIMGTDVLRSLGCENLKCAQKKSQAELLRARKKATTPDKLFQNLGGAVSIGEIFDGIANNALMLSRVIVLSGQIVAGDAEKLRKFVQDNGLMNCGQAGFCPYNSVIALDSPGGSLTESLEIAKYVQENSFVTLLLKDAVCASACSMIYLSGYTAYDGSFFPRRFAHDTAKLGMHKPYLALPTRAYSADEMNTLQDIINISLNNVVEIFVGAKVGINILKEMYETAPDDMYYLTIPEMESIGRVLHSAGAGKFPPTRAQALTLCAEEYKSRYGRYEPQLLRRMASNKDVFITYVPRSDFVCYGARKDNQWIYDICTSSGTRPDQPGRVACQLYKCASDYNESMPNCGLKWASQQDIDVINQDSMGDALKAMRNSKLLELVKDTLTDPYGFTTVTCDQDGVCFYQGMDKIPAWVTRAPVPQAYCGQVDMRSSSNLERLQRALNDNGINVGTPDGSIGPRTLGAIGTANERFMGRKDQWVEPGLLLALGVPSAEVDDFLICK